MVTLVGSVCVWPRGQLSSLVPVPRVGFYAWSHVTSGGIDAEVSAQILSYVRIRIGQNLCPRLIVIVHLQRRLLIRTTATW